MPVKKQFATIQRQIKKTISFYLSVLHFGASLLQRVHLNKCHFGGKIVVFISPQGYRNLVFHRKWAWDHEGLRGRSRVYASLRLDFRFFSDFRFSLFAQCTNPGAHHPDKSFSVSAQ